MLCRRSQIYLRTPGDLVRFFSSFFLEFFPSELDERMVARRCLNKLFSFFKRVPGALTRRRRRKPVNLGWMSLCT